MILITTVLLTILPLILGETKPNNLDPSVKTVYAKICENDDFKRTEEHLKKLKKSNKDLELKIDLLLKQQPTIQRCELNEDLKTTLKTVLSQITSEYQTELKKNLEESQSMWKIDLVDINSTLKCLESRIIQDKADNSSSSSAQFDNIGIKQFLPANCDEALQKGGESGVYKIKIPNSELEPFDVYCLTHVVKDEINPSENATAWLVVQRREDGSVDFYRNWTDYQKGFGNLRGEFFIGLDKLYTLTQSTTHQLWIQMETTDGIKSWAKYDNFSIAGASDGYALKVGTYMGNAGDGLIFYEGMKWTTKDKDNDECEHCNCAVLRSGAWWYGDCYKSNLNGRYLPSDSQNSGLHEIFWSRFNKTAPFKYVHMAIRPPR